MPHIVKITRSYNKVTDCTRIGTKEEKKGRNCYNLISCSKNTILDLSVHVFLHLQQGTYSAFSLATHHTSTVALWSLSITFAIELG